MKVEKGDRVSIPEAWLKPSLDPTRGNMRVTALGVDLLGRQLFLGEGPRLDSSQAFLAARQKELLPIWKADPVLGSLDLSINVDREKAVEWLKSDDLSVARAAFWEFQFLEGVISAIASNNAEEAAHYMAYSERFRGLRLFRAEMATAIAMAHSSKPLIWLLQEWHNQSNNKAEEYWQQVLNDHPFALSQLFAVPLVLLQSRAYVGGTQVDGKGAKFVDFLLSVDASQDSVMVEIKTPVTQILTKTPYRDGAFGPSPELSGALIQVLQYRTQFASDIRNLDKRLQSFNPRCAIIIGHARNQLCSEEQKRSFELFRRSLRDVEIITFDEVVTKLTRIAEVVGVSVSKPT